MMDFKNASEPPSAYADNPRTQTLSPDVTGASVIAVKYDSGVLIAADTLGSFGSMAKLRDVSRLHQINEQVRKLICYNKTAPILLLHVISCLICAHQ